MVAGERVIEEIAYALGQDPLEVRKLNFYGEGERNVTPYHQTVEDNVIHEIVAELEQSADYRGRRQAIREHNASSRVIKRGLALTPVKFGISFTATQYNQAGALVHVYTDGSIHLNHGGTEMGQGLYTKVAQVVAEEFQVDVDQVRITATTTGKVPNTSATAASSGSDLNGMAAQAAARTIKARLVAFAAEHWGVPQEQIEFLPGRVRVGNQEILFRELVWQAYMARVSLSATGFYKTPKIHWDRARGRGRPFYYFAYGAAVSEVAIDTLTGEYKVLRVDILHDVGRSLNPAIDIGQIEGGFVQGMGWLTTEELWWDREGRLRTHAPSTYKIPACSDRPQVFNVRLLETRREPRGHDLPVQGGRRAAADAGDLGAARDLGRDRERRGLPALPAPRPAGDAREGADDHRAPARSAPAAEGGARMTALAPILQQLLTAQEPGRAGAGRGRQGLDPARGRRRDAGHRERDARHDRRRPARVGGDRSRPRAAGERRPRRARSSCRSGPRSASAAAATSPSSCGAPARAERRRARGGSRRELAERLPLVLLFGAGHVGTALARAWRRCRCGCAGSTAGRTSSPTRRSRAPRSWSPSAGWPRSRRRRRRPRTSS